jgi:protoheme IX farnesyltransferase
MIKSYVALTKPGIIMGNLITAASGFILASKGSIDPMLFIAALVGLSLVIASACVFNNYLDRKSDQKMARTQNRPLVLGTISVKNALVFASALLLLGTSILAVYTHMLTTVLALLGFFGYVIVYGISKYQTRFATEIGSIAGAMPPLVGYTAVTNTLDAGAWILFAIIALWQMPHFYAIAMYRLNDYSAASIPVLPAVKGMFVTKVYMLLYVIAFSIAALMLSLYGYTGALYLGAVAILSTVWLWLSLKGFKATNDTVWAKKMFLYSLVTVTVLCLMISVDGVR